MPNYLDSTRRKIVWFKQVHDKDELKMKPPFQRNLVWVDKQKSYLIDTILNGYPIPEIYMQETVDDKANSQYVIVDGQQRINAVLEFLEDGFTINNDETPEYGDMTFSDLSPSDKKKFYAYDFMIRLLPEIDDKEIREIFQRLNKNTVALNRQELRQATYWGGFITTVNYIGDYEIWNKFDVFTPNDIRRMLDVEFISEMIIAALHGNQNKKDNLDKYYRIYEDEFEEAESIKESFKNIAQELSKILPNLSKTRWRKKSDFYSLFLYLYDVRSEVPFSKNTRKALQTTLNKLSDDINDFVKAEIDEKIEFSQDVRDYGAGVRASTDLNSRKKRLQALHSVLDPVASTYMEEE